MECERYGMCNEILAYQVTMGKLVWVMLSYKQSGVSPIAGTIV